MLSGVTLMVIGMGIVYLFLALLVGVIKMTAKLLHHYSPEPQPRVAFHAPIHADAAGSEDEAELVAAISAAIQRHENP